MGAGKDGGDIANRRLWVLRVEVDSVSRSCYYGRLNGDS